MRKIQNQVFQPSPKTSIYCSCWRKKRRFCKSSNWVSKVVHLPSSTLIFLHNGNGMLSSVQQTFLGRDNVTDTKNGCKEAIGVCGLIGFLRMSGCCHAGHLALISGRYLLVPPTFYDTSPYACVSLMSLIL